MKNKERFVVRCRLGYYGPDPSAKGHNLGDCLLAGAYRYTKRDAAELAGNLGAEVEEIIDETEGTMRNHSRIFRNAGAPSGVMVLNYARSKVQIPAVADVPTLVPNADKNPIFDGGPEPFFKIEAIDFPAKGSGGVYDGSFFKSFVNVTKDRPIPGSKRGHEWASRGKSDFYTVGGRIDSLDNGKSGTAYLKIYMPPEGDETSNVGLIRDARAGMVHFSLVSRPDFNVKTEKDDMGNPIQVRHFTASMGAERNDAMEYGAGAMAQIVNSSGISLDLDAARALIESGQFDSKSNVEGEPIQNGRVYRSALRRIASRANEEDRSAIGELISLIDKAKNSKHGGNLMEDKQEAVSLLSTLIANGKEKITDIAAALGFGDKLRNEDDEKNAALAKAVNAKLGDKPIERIDAILAENKATAELKVENAVREVAGEKTLKNAAGQPVDNPAHAYAAQKCAGLAGDELKNAVEALKKDPTMVALNGIRADGGSSIYRVEAGGGNSAVANESGDGIPTTRVCGKE
jgi:hypothetical protein